MAAFDELASSTEALRTRIRELGLGSLEETILRCALPALQIVPGTDGHRSFFGPAQDGPPLTGPTGRPLEALLWVHLPEAAAALGTPMDQLLGLKGLPSEGWLAFGAVLDNELALGEDLPYNDGTATVLPLPESAEPTPRAEGFAGEFQIVSFAPILTVPAMDIAQDVWGLSGELLEAYATLSEPQAGATIGPGPPPHALHYLFGHAGWLYSAAPSDPQAPELPLLAQIAAAEAVGATELKDEVLFFVCQPDRPLETLSVLVQR